MEPMHRALVEMYERLVVLRCAATAKLSKPLDDAGEATEDAIEDVHVQITEAAEKQMFYLDQWDGLGIFIYNIGSDFWELLLTCLKKDNPMELQSGYRDMVFDIVRLILPCKRQALEFKYVHVKLVRNLDPAFESKLVEPEAMVRSHLHLRKPFGPGTDTTTTYVRRLQYHLLLLRYNVVSPLVIMRAICKSLDDMPFYGNHLKTFGKCLVTLRTEVTDTITIDLPEICHNINDPECDFFWMAVHMAASYPCAARLSLVGAMEGVEHQPPEIIRAKTKEQIRGHVVQILRHMTYLGPMVCYLIMDKFVMPALQCGRAADCTELARLSVAILTNSSRVPCDWVGEYWAPKLYRVSFMRNFTMSLLGYLRSLNLGETEKPAWSSVLDVLEHYMRRHPSLAYEAALVDPLDTLEDLVLKGEDKTLPAAKVYDCEGLRVLAADVREYVCTLTDAEMKAFKSLKRTDYQEAAKGIWNKSVGWDRVSALFA